MSAAALDRRTLLRALSGLALGGGLAHAEPGHAPFGPISPPLPSPSLWLSADDGRQLELRRYLHGRITAVQLMFTRCTATCPIQGALFGAVARRLRQPDVQLLSLSIDPSNDTPAALRAWLQRFEAPARWRAAAPKATEVDRIFDFFRGRASGADRHNTRVHLFDRQARLAFRTADMPPAGQVVALCTEMARAPLR